MESGLNPLMSQNFDLRCIHGSEGAETGMADVGPLPGRPVGQAPLDSSLLERVSFVFAAVAVLLLFPGALAALEPYLGSTALPATFCIALLAVPLLAEVLVQIAARLGLFP